MNNNEKEWAGDFGKDYHERSPGNVEANRKFFDEILFGKVLSDAKFIEFGAGTGANLAAIRQLYQYAELTAVEINPRACNACRAVRQCAIICKSVLEFVAYQTWNVVLSKGLLIHIPWRDLSRAYQVLYESCASGGVIVLAEYFAPVLQEIPYRGKDGMLWKGPHAYDMLDRFRDLHLIDYGFVSSRDPAMPQDDLNWWIVEKRP